MVLQIGTNNSCKLGAPTMGSHMHMIGEEFEQGKELWRLAQKMMMTGSNAGALVHKPTFKTATVSELTRKAQLEPGQTDEKERPIGTPGEKAMKHGSLHEEAARVEYTNAITKYYKEMYLDNIVEVSVSNEVCFFIHKEGCLLASPDGEIDIVVKDKNDADVEIARFRGLIEIKCPAGMFYGSKGWYTDPAADITFELSPGLLPKAQETGRKWSGPELGEPKFNLNEIPFTDTPQSLLYEDDEFRGLGPNGDYSQHYFQCIANMYLSGREFIDYVVWMSGTPSHIDGQTHRYFFLILRSRL